MRPGRDRGLPVARGVAPRRGGYTSYGGTLDAAGMLFANRCAWAHAIATAARRDPESIVAPIRAPPRGHE
jgi:hypothetical protein